MASNPYLTFLPSPGNPHPLNHSTPIFQRLDFEEVLHHPGAKMALIFPFCTYTPAHESPSADSLEFFVKHSIDPVAVQMVLVIFNRRAYHQDYKKILTIRLDSEL